MVAPVPAAVDALEPAAPEVADALAPVAASAAEALEQEPAQAQALALARAEAERLLEAGSEHANCFGDLTLLALET